MSSSTIILVTGANTGLGYVTVQALCSSQQHYTILLGGRSLEKATAAADELRPQLQGNSTVEPVQIDIEDDKSIEALVKTIQSKYGKLDVLLNNAGGQFDQQVPTGNISMRDMWAKSWNVNVTSTFIITEALAPLLLKSSNPRLLFITSGTSTLTEHGNPKLAVDNSPDAGWPKKTLMIPAYRSSKVGMNMMMREWYRLLKNDGVKVWCVSPGFLATNLGFGKEKLKEMGAIDPSVGAKLVVSVVEGEHDSEVGKVVRAGGPQPW